MKQKSIIMATFIFIGGFIPLKGTIQNERNVYYQLYAKSTESYLECNEIKKEILRVYDSLPIYKFNDVKKQLKNHLKDFEFSGVNSINFDDKNLILNVYLDDSNSLVMKGYLYEVEANQNILNKKYFIEQIFH